MDLYQWIYLRCCEEPKEKDLDNLDAFSLHRDILDVSSMITL